ncbi:hypothetical protein [Modicisalibacter luteus]|uniref:MarR family transcriptional regulator n=1 Tax=Modicisalibacter luteus TaxID=453962 RepID=A0ABV7M470_9GAMM|nr:hypothetical protein [Halomonas lutea]GHA85259.1 hypothetical protein GCM10007159_02930 [Halomonas lutea]
MKPIDEQNAVLLMLRRAGGTPETITAELRAGGVAMTLHQVRQTLARLKADGLVKVAGDSQVMGKVASPIHVLTAAGRSEAEQLPEGE